MIRTACDTPLLSCVCVVVESWDCVQNQRSCAGLSLLRLQWVMHVLYQVQAGLLRVWVGFAVSTSRPRLSCHPLQQTVSTGNVRSSAHKNLELHMRHCHQIKLTQSNIVTDSCCDASNLNGECIRLNP